MLERELEYKSINSDKFKLPKPHLDGDFHFHVDELHAGELLPLFSSPTTSVRKLDSRRVDDGTYQFSSDMANGRQSKKHQWYAQISIQAALWIIDCYINKFLVQKKMLDHTDKNVVVSKQKMREVLL